MEMASPSESNYALLEDGGGDGKKPASVASAPTVKPKSIVVPASAPAPAPAPISAPISAPVAPAAVAVTVAASQVAPKPASVVPAPSTKPAAAGAGAQAGGPAAAAPPSSLLPTVAVARPASLSEAEPVSFLRRPSAVSSKVSVDYDSNYLQEFPVGSHNDSIEVVGGVAERRGSQVVSMPAGMIQTLAGSDVNGGEETDALHQYSTPLYGMPSQGAIPATVRNDWEFPGWGKTSKFDYTSSALRKNLQDSHTADGEAEAREEHKLSEWPATAICGNDITSSCFYCTGLVANQAGVWAPLCMVLVSITLYLFRSVYGEAVTALPLNGGAYNVLLNTTSKQTASIAACLTILSYTATGVVSAASAAAYLQNLWTGEDVYWVVVGLLVLFALLSLLGMSESANTALVIFAVHIATLLILVVAGTVHVIRNGIDPAKDLWVSPSQPAITRALFYGFASAMLGVTGFETSANFVEEQKEGVFVKTLRNMWAICAFFNPLLSLLCVFVVDAKLLANAPNDSLATLGLVSAGRWLQVLVSVDAFIVLSGAVLTSYVGFTGLLRRLAMDRCVPAFLLAENSWRRTNHYIIFGFLGLCWSLYTILNGNVDTLANVYTVSFLGVMGLFSIGNMILKYKRNDLPRSVRATWPTVIAGFALVAYAFAGTVVLNPSILGVWLLYFSATALLVGSMFFRVHFLKCGHYFCRSARKAIGADDNSETLQGIAETIQSIRRQPVAFFAKRPTASVINKAILYVRQNEVCFACGCIYCSLKIDLHSAFNPLLGLLQT